MAKRLAGLKVLNVLVERACGTGPRSGRGIRAEEPQSQGVPFGAVFVHRTAAVKR